MATTTPPAISGLPAAPDPNDRSTFNTRAYPWSAALPTLSTEIAAVATNVKANADDAKVNADIAVAQVPLATAQVALAAGQVALATAQKDLAQQAALSAGAIAWVSGTTYAVGDLRYSPIDFQTYRRKTAGAGTTDPSADGAGWTKVATPSLVRSARTSNTAIGLDDQSKLIDITSGAFTQTFSAAATLGNGWFCYLRNSGTGDITLDPNGAETIDELASFVMYPGEVRLVQCDGTALRSVVLNAFYRTFTASATFTKPPGYSLFAGLLWGAGGSGGKGGQFGSASGGGGGACVPFTYPTTAIGTTETVTIGSGGSAQGVDFTSGTAGGNSTFGSLLTSYGGGRGFGTNGFSACSGGGGGGGQSAGGDASSASTLGGEPLGTNASNSGFGGAGSASSAGYFAAYGGGSGAGCVATTPSARAGGASIHGGGGGGNAGYPSAAGAGGLSSQGGSGGAGVAQASGAAGSAPGGGGGGTGTGASSGAGARGELRIWGGI